MVSAIQEQRDIIVDTIKSITRGDWKVLVVDESTRKIIDNVVKEDDILNENIANIERIEDQREMNPDMDAIYFLSPQPHIVDCLMADFEQNRYRKSFLVWSAPLDPQMRRRIENSSQAKAQLVGFEILSIDFFPQESQLVTLRDPWSFPILYHPACNSLVWEHLQSLARKIASICVLLGENPKVRYYKPRNTTHKAHVLCSHLATFVQEELDAYVKWNQKFPPQSSRPTGIMIITDRSMDLNAPLIHEFTYQAMAHDLLPIKQTDKTYYKTVVNRGQIDQEEKEMEISEKDKIWVENRHRHMKDTIERLMNNFQKFIDENPNFTKPEGDATGLNAIKDMLAGLPQFQELKEAYSLHLNMAQECMNIFESQKLPDIASVEQTLSTGLDEDYRKPKNITDQLVRLLDEDISASDRRRLIMLYIISRDGVILEDIQRLLAHAKLPPQDGEIITNLDLLGAHTTKTLKETRNTPQPVFTRKTAPSSENEEYSLSRYEPMVKLMLEEVIANSLDQTLFPYTKPPLNSAEEMALQSQSSLRSAKPTWARNRQNTDSRQRIIVFVAGGATYSELRSCYEVSRASGKDVFIATSHMLTPSLFSRQVGDLSADRRTLDLPIDRPKPRAPAYLFARNNPQTQSRSGTPSNQNQGTNANFLSNSVRPGILSTNTMQDKKSIVHQSIPNPPISDLTAMNSNQTPFQPAQINESSDISSLKAKSDKKSKHKEGEKKKRGFFGSKK